MASDQIDLPNVAEAVEDLVDDPEELDFREEKENEEEIGPKNAVFHNAEELQSHVRFLQDQGSKFSSWKHPNKFFKKVMIPGKKRTYSLAKELVSRMDTLTARLLAEDSSKPLLIFVHGFTSSSKNLPPPSDDVPVLYFDWDAGKTPAGWRHASTTSLPLIAPLLLYFLERLRRRQFQRPIYLIGHSLGTELVVNAFSRWLGDAPLVDLTLLVCPYARSKEVFHTNAPLVRASKEVAVMWTPNDPSLSRAQRSVAVKRVMAGLTGPIEGRPISGRVYSLRFDFVDKHSKSVWINFVVPFLRAWHRGVRPETKTTVFATEEKWNELMQ